MNARRLLEIANWALRGVLHTAPLPHPVPVPVERVCVCNPCPCCGQSLTAGPHFHDEGVIWETDTPEVVLLTDQDGSNPCVFYRGVS